MSEEQKTGKPVNGERAFENTDKAKHKKIVAYVNEVKNAYWRDSRTVEYFDNAKKIRQLVDQKWSRDRSTRFGLRHGLMRATYDSYVDTFTDLFDVDDLIFYRGETQAEQQMASDLQTFTNRLLRSIKYQRHLHTRFLNLPIYGWSPAYDFYRQNDGYVTKPQAKSYLPELQGLAFTKEMDSLNDGPVAETLRPEMCYFGSPQAAAWEQTSRGCVTRWYLRDVLSAMQKTTADGKKCYNMEALKKLAEALQSGQNDSEKTRMDRSDAMLRDVDFESDKARGPYVDVTRYYGPLNEISDSDLAKDANSYYIECTQTTLLLWLENPADRHTMFTDMRTHELTDSPLSRSFLDAVKPHQQFTDFLTNMSMESLVDNLTKHWAVWEEDIEDPDKFYNPRGLNSFLNMQGQGRLPEVIGQMRSGAWSDVKDILTLLDRDRQRVGASDQEMGVLGGTQDKTATAARILASASSKKTRAAVKRICNDAIVPQVKNLVMLALVYSKPQALQILSGDRKIEITPAHVEWFLRGANVQTNDTITRDRDSEALKITSFLQGATQILGGLSDPAPAVNILRYAAEVQGLPRHVIDTALPAPSPVDASPSGNMPPALPPMPGPQGAAEQNPMMEGGMDEMAL